MADVYGKISAVQGELAAIGISKDRKNEQQGFMFRGIDDVYGAMAPILAKHQLCILPRVLTRTCTERQSARGTPLYFVVVECEFDIVSATDASCHTIRTIGEAMDNGDKATNKAMSVAYREAAFKTFCIPLEGHLAGGDADATSHEVVEKPRPQKPIESPKPAPAPPPAPKPDLAALKRKIWARAEEVKMTGDEIKAYSIKELKKDTSKNWTVEDCDKILTMMAEKEGK